LCAGGLRFEAARVASPGPAGRARRRDATPGANRSATTRFRSSNEYPWTSDYGIVGATYQEALQFFIETGLSGLVSEEDYPVGGERRVVQLRPDINGDEVVNVMDLLMLLGAWGPCEGCPEDVDGHGVVDLTDLLALLAAWD